jgi:hypothetical protein
MSYSENDIKLLKYEKRPGYIFSTMGSIFALFFDFFFILFLKQPNWYNFLIVNGLLFGCATLVLFLMNRKINIDLLYQEITSIKRRIINEEEMVDYEPGVRYMGMKEYTKHVLTFENETYNVTQTFFNEINIEDTVELQYSKYSDTFLGIYKSQ